MKKINTSSPYTFIMDDFNRGKFIRTYKRSGLNGYKRYVPLKKIFELLKRSNIKHPRVIKNRLFYLDIEFIEGSPIPENFKPSLMLNLFCNNLFEMHQINCRNILGDIPYRSNQGFLNDNINNLLVVMDRLGNYETLDRVGLRRDMVVALKSIAVDDTRPMQLIHGDFSPENIIMRGNDYYIIDWEFATLGDIAYEIALHMMYFKYDDDEKNQLFQRIAQTLNIDINSLVNDVRTYTKFELMRRTFLKFNRAINLAKRGKPFDEILLDGFNYYAQISNAYTIESIRQTFRDLYRG